MPTLRLAQFAESQPDHYRVQVTLDNGAPARSTFSFALSPQDREDFRWYLEDYLEYPLDPAPKIAARIETRMSEVGQQLFRNVFESSETARRMWARIEDQLDDTRVEVITGIREATTIPWELLRDPLTDQALALRAASFVRTQADAVRPATLALEPSPLKGEGSSARVAGRTTSVWVRTNAAARSASA